MAAIIFSNVVLPEPEGPISAMNSPDGNLDGYVVQRLHFKRVALKNFADVANLHNFGLVAALGCVLVLMIVP